MKIDRIDTYLVRIPLKKPYMMVGGAIDHIDSMLVRMQSGGISGWGEVFPGNEPVLTAAWSTSVFACIRDCLLPQLGMNLSVDSVASLTERFQTIKGNQYAKAALDLAWWDLDARIKNQPLHKVLGGDAEKEIEIGLTFDRFDSPDEFLDEIQRAVDDGFQRLTLKIRPGWDLQVLGAVRSDHPLLTIQCDVEGSLCVDQHSDTLYRFDDFMPALLEQPLSADDYVGHAMLQDTMRTSICLDESITTRHQAEIALDLRSAKAFCVKPGRVGGLTEAKAIHDIARAGEVDCYAGCDILTSIGYRFVVALASLPGFRLPTDYLRFDEHLSDDPGIPLLPVHNGQQQPVVRLWNEPGIGFDPDLELIERLTLQRCSVPS